MKVYELETLVIQLVDLVLFCLERVEPHKYKFAIEQFEAKWEYKKATHLISLDKEVRSDTTTLGAD